ncbi:hypothetical protein [Desulfosporosinus nitroreducens]|uniref:hypothetical protein n=1 Tax=Desulfosporosinus nitroreducens TaxID=2018668 RepID=UPI00207CBED5|nr:hypothetical protein [Desulfosporosinus nitroreducens]MCO1604469.1 hypothetical protein [Desulfosporosinus nitroreducens]
MKPKKRKQYISLMEEYLPSEPCNCEICKAYCIRPGWWTVEEASIAIDAGYGDRMMLEMSLDLTFGVLSPAYKGCEQNFALQEYSHFGCIFFSNNLCELHDNGFQPLECRFCHHSREGLRQKCHADIEKQWLTPAGQALVAKWITMSRIRCLLR